ncbi:hypothetical protein E1B28_005890 [Marasmius oreades]|uniref:Uncharacterized protein n=1 Tax=Marasmius oreades TaxID=181124 RepID=A0A9P7UV15_9AGAR|nr:uncharacterized protein E1B28_005890 [Marasmius oreades]KAG7095103.1 hypothetical protein E1B28_005890 [Marasmius oreades]
MSTTNSSIQDSPQLQVRSVIVFPIVTVMVMCVTYGLYIALFALCIYILRQGKIRYQTFYIWSLTALFVMSTSMVAVETVEALLESVVEFSVILPILANLSADSILIQRCYIIWGSRNRVLIPLIVVSFATNVITSTGVVMLIMGLADTTIASNEMRVEKGGTIQAVGLIISAAFNLALTLLTAGRIWWISHQSYVTTKNYIVTTMNKIILESGMIYPLVMILHLSITNGFSMDQVPLDTFPLVILAAGIAPTLMIIRMRLGIYTSKDNTGITLTNTQRLRSGGFLSSIQPDSLYFSALSVIGMRRFSRMEGNHVKSLPRELEPVYAV